MVRQIGSGGWQDDSTLPGTGYPVDAMQGSSKDDDDDDDGQ
tara:strand:+ start:45 stop:167 length:123 start_codon:yes stop_codon:yes gene_type:complete